MMKTRKVGTLTLGTTLITFGLLFLIRIFTDIISYHAVMKLWPLIFIFLGIEIIYSYFNKKEDTFTYDAAAILIIITLSVFAMGMATVEYILSNGVHHTLYF